MYVHTHMHVYMHAHEHTLLTYVSNDLFYLNKQCIWTLSVPLEKHCTKLLLPESKIKLLKDDKQL